MIYLKECIKKEMQFIKKHLSFSKFAMTNQDKLNSQIKELNNFKDNYNSQNNNALFNKCVTIILLNHSFNLQKVIDYLINYSNPCIFSITFNNIIKKINNKIPTNKIKLTSVQRQNGNYSFELIDGQRIYLMNITDNSYDEIQNKMRQNDCIMTINSGKNKFLVCTK